MNHDDNSAPQSVLNPNSIAFIALCKEYCQALAQAREAQRDEFISLMLKLLPRIYITATDLSVNFIETEEPYIDPALEEDYYEGIRRNVETLMGPDDIYLEVFEEDMKYSDTPVSASIAEGLADLFQVLFNFISALGNDPTDEVAAMSVLAIKEDFRNYWSRILCNVLRPLNDLAYKD
ncbi:MAG: DUF5063 domain-containing protein [Muribaculaceae bacterium]|nr:DUF5063 domain-containing protein [Muribaculaceae bacterium]MDE6810119.1 DUF5063 domain-containing protein [Muribaculaceae bacterium]